MAISFVQREDSQTLSSGTPAQVTTFPSSTTNGNLIIVIVYWRGVSTTVSSVTDDASNTYYRAGTAQIQPDGYDNIDVWYAFNISGKSSHAVTTTLSGTTSWYTVYIQEWSGALITAGVYDKSTGASPSGATYTDWTLGTLTPATAGALILIPCYTGVTVIETEPSPQTGELTDRTSRWCYYYVQPTVAAYTADMTSLSQTRYCGKVVIFLETAFEIWIDVAEFAEVELDGRNFTSGQAMVDVQLWAAKTNVTIQARLYDVVNDNIIGTSAVVEAITPTDASFPITIPEGPRHYRLQVTSDTTNVDLFAIGAGVVF